MLKHANKNKRFQRTSFALILLLIMSQSLSAAVACKMEMADHDMPSSQSLIANDLHAGHDMSTMDMKPDMQNDCCDTDCQCAQNTCSGSSPMINNSMNSVFNLNHHASFSNEHKIIYYQATSALFRPPIIC